MRMMVWYNSGFGNLCKIRRHLDDYEHRYDPTVIPMGDSLHRVNTGDALRSSSCTSTTENLQKRILLEYSVAD